MQVKRNDFLLIAAGHYEECCVTDLIIARCDLDLTNELQAYIAQQPEDPSVDAFLLWLIAREVIDLFPHRVIYRGDVETACKFLTATARRLEPPDVIYNNFLAGKSSDTEPIMRCQNVHAICPSCAYALATQAYWNNGKLLTHLPTCPKCATDIRAVAWHPAP